MAYLALYRQWRPQDFDQLVGQEHINTTLKNAITTGKVAHAYLFTGPRGTGKTSTAKILAKALNCEQGPTPKPCNQCESCRGINDGSSMDVFEIDAASNRGIDEIRELRETVKFSPVSGRRKVYIIDEVHMLTTEAFNALLKTLEEPPEHVVFILATTEPHRIPATIHSRCQRYDFHRVAVDVMIKRLAEVAAGSSISVEPTALQLIAVHAEGGMRDALSLLDQCASMETETVTEEAVRGLLGLVGQEWMIRLTDRLLHSDGGGALQELDEIFRLGKDARQILAELIQYLRGLLLYKAAPALESRELALVDKEVLERQSRELSQAELTGMLDRLFEASQTARWSTRPRIHVEMALLSLCQRSESQDTTALTRRIQALEQQVQKLTLGQSRKEQEPSLPLTAPAVTAPARKEIAAKPPKPESDSLRKAVLPAAELPESVEKPAPVLVDDTDLAGLWEAVLKELLNRKKRSAHACVAQGKLAEIKEQTAVLEFPSQFTKERTEKKDFRTLLEEILANLTGRQLQLLCRVGGTMKEKEPSSANSQEVSEEEIQQNPILRKALEMFPGTVTREQG